MWRRYKGAIGALEVVTHGGVVGQAWRGRGPRQARLARALEGMDIRALDSTLGRSAGELLAGTRTSDVIDAAVALLADDGDVVYSSDPDDLEPLLVATNRHVELVPV